MLRLSILIPSPRPGGQSGAYSPDPNKREDLWVLDTATASWQELSPTGDVPGAMSEHSCAALGGALFLLDGGDLRKYNVTVNEWSIVDVPGIKPTAGIMVHVRGLIWVLRQNVFTEELWVFDHEQGTWRDVSSHVRGASPPSRGKQGCTVADDRIYVFGGDRLFGSNDLWVLDAAEGYLRPGAELVWTELSAGALLGSAPFERYDMGMAALGGRMYIFGGEAPSASGRHLP